MVLGWLSWRWTASQRSLAVILLASSFVISLRSLIIPPSYPPPFKVVLEFTPEPSRKPSVGVHTYTPDGLLVVHPDAPHPIFQLIREAETAWEAKCARASTTLDDAVAEYKRRYRRAPPLGFDKWWDYVVKHRIQLPDEYDEIYEDLEPFWGIDPAELARTQAALEASNGVVTVAKSAHQPQLEVVRSTLSPDRQHLLHTINNIFGLVRDVAHELPPLRVTLSPFDNPSMLSDWRIRNMAREAAANGTTLTSADLPAVTESGWIQACSPDSPAWLYASMSRSSGTTPPAPSPKTFIASHRATMDPCMHPSLLTSHGQFLSHNDGPFPQKTLSPRFSLCRTTLHHDIRPPLPYGWKWESDTDPDDDPGQDEGESAHGAFEGDIPWERKVDVRLGWRGRTTGMYASADSQWTQGHRARLVTLTNALEGNVTVLRVPERTHDDDVPPVGEPEIERLAYVNPAWMDIAFTDGPVGCDEPAGTCSEMARLWEFRRMQERHEEGRYRFILDVDGNGWSGRFKRLMTSNALIFKATIYPEWYMSRIAPWVHYVPIQISYTDLHDAVAFFRVHDDLAARIAKAGRDWSRRYWRREDMTAYLYRLLLEYARLTSLDRTSMDYVG